MTLKVTALPTSLSFDFFICAIELNLLLFVILVICMLVIISCPWLLWLPWFPWLVLLLLPPSSMPLCWRLHRLSSVLWSPQRGGQKQELLFSWQKHVFSLRISINLLCPLINPMISISTCSDYCLSLFSVMIWGIKRFIFSLALSFSFLICLTSFFDSFSLWARAYSFVIFFPSAGLSFYSDYYPVSLEEFFFMVYSDVADWISANLFSFSSSESLIARYSSLSWPRLLNNSAFTRWRWSREGWKHLRLTHPPHCCWEWRTSPSWYRCL